MDYTYLHDIHTMYENNGELHLVSQDKTVIFNCEELFNDLPGIFELVLKARNENTKQVIKEINKTTNKNKSL